MRKRMWKDLLYGTTAVLALALLTAWPAAPAAAGDEATGTPRWTMDEVYTGLGPFAIGHRGYGENPWYAPDLVNPVENTTKAVRRGFRDGVQVVEIDANLTADNMAVVLHDDFLPDLTCVNDLTFEQLKLIMGDDNIKSLRNVLQVSRTYSVENSERPGGLVVLEIKTPSPHCVSLDEEPAVLDNLVSAVVGAVRFTRMEQQVTIESFSPEILQMVSDIDGNIPTALALDLLQLLPPDVILDTNPGLVIEPIDKHVLGLPWGEVGVNMGGGQVLWLYRVPGYYQGGFFTPYAATLLNIGAATASLDKNVLGFLLMHPEFGVTPADIVGLLHAPPFNQNVWVYTAQNDMEWGLAASAGADGIMIDDIPWGLDLEN